MTPILTTASILAALLATLLAAAPAQEPQPAAQQQPPANGGKTGETPAEQQFRDAWWAETGRNDLETALRGYLGAAIADGPGAVRAKALLHAGRLQQRLGKADAALATFRKVVTEHASEREVVALARTHLRELTAVDLRQNYDEWYERRLFGEEVQLVILGKIEALAQKLSERAQGQRAEEALRNEQALLRGEILAFGRGAVPALRKTCESGNEALRERAINMLFALGELPPVRALASSGDWMTDSTCWARLLAAAGTGQAPPESTAWQRPLLAAALQGPVQLADVLLHSTDPQLQDCSDVVTAITVALLQHDQGRAAVLAGAFSPATPLRLRPAMEQALVWEHQVPLPLSAQQWLDVTKEPLRFELRIVGVRRATALLQPQDGELLETILQRLESAPANARQELLSVFGNSIARALAPQQLPWTQSRLRRALAMTPWSDGDAVLAQAVFAMKQQLQTRALLADALLGDPAAFLQAVQGAGGAIGMLAGTLGEDGSGDLRDAVLLDGHWHEALVAVLQAQWGKWDDAARCAALTLLEMALRPDSDKGRVVAFLKTSRDGATEPVRAAIEALLASFGG